MAAGAPFPLAQGEEVRTMDDGRREGETEATSMFEILVLCNAAQPELDARSFAMEARSQRVRLQYSMRTIDSGNEECPTHFALWWRLARARHCLFDPSTTWKFQESGP